MLYQLLVAAVDERKLSKSAPLCVVAKQVGTQLLPPFHVSAALNRGLLFFGKDFERMTPHIHDLSKKQSVTSQSLEKIEDGSTCCLIYHETIYSELSFLAAYAIAIRSSEYDLPEDMLEDIVAKSISGLGVGSAGRSGGGGMDEECNSCF